MKSNSFKIEFLNHSSLKIIGQNKYLTDPWYISNAFGKWTQNPQPFFHDVKKLSREKNLNILISHGHDDHLDDFFVKNYLNNPTLVIPQLKSKGFLRRVDKLSKNQTIEVDDTGFQFNKKKEKIYSFVCEETLSEHDSIILISNENEVIIHANDNWQLISEDIREKIKKICEGKYIYYFSQVGVANAYPMFYGGYKLNEIKKKITSRVKNYLNSLEMNIKHIKPNMVYSYANQSKFFDDKNLDTYKITQQIIENSKFVKQLNIGDKIINQKLFKNKFERETLFNELLKYIGVNFKDFLKKKKLVDFEIFFKSSNHTKDKLEKQFKPKKNQVYYVTKDYIWCDIMSGKINLETISIGGNGYIFKNKATNIVTVHRLLSEFAYIFQHKLCKEYF